MMLTATGHNTQLSPNIKRTLPPVRAACGRHEGGIPVHVDSAAGQDISG